MAYMVLKVIGRRTEIAINRLFDDRESAERFASTVGEGQIAVAVRIPNGAFKDAMKENTAALWGLIQASSKVPEVDLHNSFIDSATRFSKGAVRKVMNGFSSEQSGFTS